MDTGADAPPPQDTATYRFETTTGADGETIREYDDEAQHELDEDETESAATESGPVSKSWGDGLAREVVDWLLLERLRYNVILPGADGADGVTATLRQRFGLKISLDAAAVRKARKGHKHWTTLIVQVLCQGVKQGAWGEAAVKHMLHKAQSPDFIAKVRVWQGKDDGANFRAHVTPLVQQLVELEANGHDCAEILMPLPPVLVKRGAQECEPDQYVTSTSWRQHATKTASTRYSGADGLGPGNRAYLHLQDLRGATGGKNELGQLGRLAVVRAVRVFPSLMLCLDGGTWASASGVPVSAKERNDFLTNLTRKEQRTPYRWRWLEAGDCVYRWCDRMRPGDKAFYEVAVMGLDRSKTGALSALTEDVPRKGTTAPMAASAAPAPAQRGLFGGSAAQQASAAASRAHSAATDSSWALTARPTASDCSASSADF